ncbi:MAG TPA: alpha/beta hydrolase, partial [Vicinamibacterales bacterium]|nr:alpha/beta hydrolase [Vicinamibacterales bacterium]
MDIIARNNVTVFGRGMKPMVFVHGFGCDQQMWRFITPAFDDDYRIVQFDYVGHGGSDRSAYDPDRYATLDGFAQDILDVVNALDLENVILVGHSVSSITGVLAINREPGRFERLIMVSPSPRYINDPPDYRGGFERVDIEGLLDMMDKNYVRWAGTLAPMIVKNDDRPELAAELNDSFCSTDPVVARQFAEVTFLSDNRADLAHVRVPSV